MQTYVLRRVLLMIPTLFGISLVVWLVMALSPGRLGEKAGGLGTGERDLSKDPTKLARENEAERNFRRQFGLDRPTFLNFWYDLTAEELRETVRIAHAPIEEVGAEEKRKARFELEDYGYYAVPALVELLQRTEGEEQTYVRYWLGRNAVRITIKPAGGTIDEKALRRIQEQTRENRRLSKLTWERGASPEERDPVVREWTDWYETHRDRWEYGFWRKVGITLADTQFATYWGRLLRGDFGQSHVHKRPVVDLVLERMKYSLTLNVVALILAYILAVPIGIYNAVRQGSFTDRATAVVLFALYSLPNFFVGTLLIKWCATGEPWEWAPIGGFESENAAEMSTVEHLKDILWHITLPLVCLTYVSLAFLSRFARSGMLEVIRSDYIRTARAKGLSGWTVVSKHVVRNGVLPIVTLLGGVLPILIGGSAVIEYIFNINGMGLLMINSIFQKDFNVVMGVQIMIGVLTMIGILLADIAYAVLDPRISLS